MQYKSRDFTQHPVSPEEMQYYVNKARRLQSQALHDMVSGLFSGVSRALRNAAGGVMGLFRSTAVGGQPRSAGSGPSLS